MNRNSSIELLRVFAMMMILIIHANFFSVHIPSAEECISSSAFSLSRFILCGLSIIGVDIFILISGYFGIRTNARKFANIIFQFVFYSLILTALSAIFGFGDGFSIRNMASTIFLTSDFWFVKSYLILFLLAPALNFYVENTSKKELGWTAISFLFFQCIFGWTGSIADFNDGFSALSFIGIYLLARYLRKYPVNITVNKYSYLAMYLGSAVILGMLGFISVKFALPNREFSMIFSYLNPLVLFSAWALFSFFKELSFDSRIVNRLGASAFAVYLIHCNPNILNHYSDASKWIYSEFTGIKYFTILLVFIIVVYILCAIVDELRIRSWKAFEKTVFDKK